MSNRKISDFPNSVQWHMWPNCFCLFETESNLEFALMPPSIQRHRLECALVACDVASTGDGESADKTLREVPEACDILQEQLVECGSDWMAFGLTLPTVSIMMMSLTNGSTAQCKLRGTPRKRKCVTLLVVINGAFALPNTCEHVLKCVAMLIACNNGKLPTTHEEHGMAASASPSQQWRVLRWCLLWSRDNL